MLTSQMLSFKLSRERSRNDRRENEYILRKWLPIFLEEVAGKCGRPVFREGHCLGLLGTAIHAGKLEPNLSGPGLKTREK